VDRRLSPQGIDHGKDQRICAYCGREALGRNQCCSYQRLGSYAIVLKRDSPFGVPDCCPVSSLGWVLDYRESVCV